MLLEQGAEPVSQGDMTRIAALWDPVEATNGGLVVCVLRQTH